MMRKDNYSNPSSSMMVFLDIITMITIIKIIIKITYAYMLAATSIAPADTAKAASF